MEFMGEMSENAICEIFENVEEIGEIACHTLNEKARKCSILLHILSHGCFGNHR
jgi:hypothetical protein